MLALSAASTRVFFCFVAERDAHVCSQPKRDEPRQPPPSEPRSSILEQLSQYLAPVRAMFEELVGDVKVTFECFGSFCFETITCNFLMMMFCAFGRACLHHERVHTHVNLQEDLQKHEEPIAILPPLEHSLVKYTLLVNLDVLAQRTRDRRLGNTVVKRLGVDYALGELARFYDIVIFTKLGQEVRFFLIFFLFNIVTVLKIKLYFLNCFNYFFLLYFCWCFILQEANRIIDIVDAGAVSDLK